jgi:hypothetical protein
VPVPVDAVVVGRWWWEGGRHPTLHTLLVHVCVEAARHAGHADVLRELIDGAVGMSAANPNLPERGDTEWAAFHDRIEAAAREAAGRPV